MHADALTKSLACKITSSTYYFYNIMNIASYTFEIITTTTPTIPYYTINPSYCWMPDLENQEWSCKREHLVAVSELLQDQTSYF